MSSFAPIGQSIGGSSSSSASIASKFPASGPVAILWDIENCPVPGEVNPEDVAGNVRQALGAHPSPALRGAAVTMFSAYGDFHQFPRKLREGCQRTGVNLIDVPNSKKNASDKAILVDMFLFALDNPPPSAIFLITGDVDFAPALHKLAQRGYTVVLAIPTGFVSGSLCSAGRFVWDWASVARGHGLIAARPPPLQPQIDHLGLSGASGAATTSVGVSGAATSAPATSLTPDLSHGFQHQSLGSLGFQHQSLGHQQQALPPRPGSPTDFVVPGDLAGLKQQLVKLLSLHGGRMRMLKVAPEYLRLYGRPLVMLEYGCKRLIHLIGKMPDTVCIKGERSERMVHLTKAAAVLAVRYKSVWGTALSRKSKDKEAEAEEDEEEAEEEQEHEHEEEAAPPLKEESKSVVDEEVVVYMSSMRVAGEPDSAAAAERDQTGSEAAIEIPEVATSRGRGRQEQKAARDMFRQELRELLVSFQYQMLVSDFGGLYRQRYGKEPDYGAFGVAGLEELLEKVADVAVLRETRDRRFLVANVGFVETED